MRNQRPEPPIRLQRRSAGNKQRWQLGEGADLPVGGAGQPLAALAVTVAPHHAHAEGGGRIGVPGIGGLEGDGGGRQAEPVDGQLIDARMRLENADVLDLQNMVEKAAEACARHGAGKHGRRAVGQDGGDEAGLLQLT